jgi:rhodanese-related sulfurtransferase
VSERPSLRVAEILAEAREGLERLSPEEAQAAVDRGAALVDIRADSQIADDGVIPGAIRVPRNVLEWRCEPGGEDSMPELARTDRLLVVFCNEGYQSSLAAATLRRLGVDATDLDGGFQRWRDEGLPVDLPG